MPWATPQQVRHPHSKLFHRKPRASPVVTAATAPVAQPMWVGWSGGSGFVPPAPYAPPAAPPNPLLNPLQTLKAAFPGLGDLSNVRLSTLCVERVCGLVGAALGAGGAAAGDALRAARASGLVLAHCRLEDLQPVLNLPFGDWELFKLLIINLREIESNAPMVAPSVTVIAEKSVESETDSVKRSGLELQRSRPSNVEKQVTLEEQMICGALQTLNEEAMEDVLQSEPASHPDEEGELHLRRVASGSRWAGSATSGRRRDPPAVTFSVENEADSEEEGQITFSAPTTRPVTLAIGDSSPTSDQNVKGMKKTAKMLKKVGSSERISRLKEKIMSRGGGAASVEELVRVRNSSGSEDESAPLVGGVPEPPSAELSPRSDGTGAESPRELAPFDLLPEEKGTRARASSVASVGNMVEPYNLRLVRGASDAARLWRQDALDSGPPWPGDEPDSAV